MARYRGYQCSASGCQIRIYKGSLCGQCRKKWLEKTYGLSFTGLFATPTERFWRAWRKDSDAIKRQGMRVRKENGRWFVQRGERSM